MNDRCRQTSIKHSLPTTLNIEGLPHAHTNVMWLSFDHPEHAPLSFRCVQQPAVVRERSIHRLQDGSQCSIEAYLGAEQSDHRQDERNRDHPVRRRILSIAQIRRDNLMRRTGEAGEAWWPVGFGRTSHRASDIITRASRFRT